MNFFEVERCCRFCRVVAVVDANVVIVVASVVPLVCGCCFSFVDVAAVAIFSVVVVIVYAAILVATLTQLS